MDVRVYLNLSYLRAYVATHMQGQKSLALLTSQLMSFHKKPHWLLLETKEMARRRHRAMQNTLFGPFTVSRAHAVLLIALLMIIILLSRCSPCLMLHAHDNWLHQLGLDAAPPRTCVLFCSFQTRAKTCEGLSILALSVNSSATHVSVRLVHALA